MFFIVPILLFMLLAIEAGAQHPVTSVQSCPDNIKIKYVLQGENSTFVFATYTKQTEDQSEICLSRKTVACNEDENFKLLEAYSMPISDEADQAFILLDQIGQKLNFVLEFEKIPLGESFDIRSLDYEDRSFVVTGITTDTSIVKKVDGKRFIESTPYVKRGKYFKDGKTCIYYTKEGVWVTIDATLGSEYLTLNVSIVNDSDHGILLDLKKMTAISKKIKSDKEIEEPMHILSKSEYNDIWARSDANDEYYMKSNSALGKAGSLVNHESWQHDVWSWERTGLEVLGAIMEEENERSIQPYKDRLDATRKEGLKDYLQSQSIAAGDSYSGYIKIKRVKKQKSADVNIIVDGINCKTDWTISK